MILTPHILAGAALATQISNPVAIIPAALAAHYLLDAVPHWDYDIRSSRKAAIVKVTADIALASTLIFYMIWNLAPEKQINILIGGFFGVMPDGLLFLSWIIKKNYLAAFTRFHDFWHGLIIPKGQQPAFWWGLGVQILIIALSLFFLLLRIA